MYGGGGPQKLGKLAKVLCVGVTLARHKQEKRMDPKTTRIKITLPDAERNLLKQMARRFKLSEADIVRRLIRHTAALANIQPPAPAPEGRPAAAEAGEADPQSDPGCDPANGL
jgi:hypothetical protein